MQRNAAMQTQLARDQFDLSTKSLAKRDALRQPAIDFYSGIATGDINKIMYSLAPSITQSTKAYNQSRQNILDKVVSGPVRDSHLAGLERDRFANNASMFNNAYMSAFPALANLSNEDASLSMNQMGAGFRGLEGSQQSNQALMQAAAQRKASTMGMVGGLAQMAGGAATGGFGGGFGRIFGGGGGGGYSGGGPWAPGF